MKDKVAAWVVVLLFIVGIGLGILTGVVSLRDINRGRPLEMIPVGEHQIVALVAVESNYALVVLDRGDVELEPRYYRVEKEEVINFEDISSATKLIKISETNLEYIEFK